MTNPIMIIFELVVLIFSVIIHEISHGTVALLLGDETAKRAGRLTLNPLKHLDPLGSFLVPLFLFILGGPVFGWAKPVPYNPLNLKNPKLGAGLIGAAGPLSNLLVALIFAIFLRLSTLFVLDQESAIILILLQFIILINIGLAIFNLVPLPPLDGSNILFAILPEQYAGLHYFLARYGFYIIIFLIAINGLNFIVPVISFIFRLFVGSSGIF